MSNRKRYRRGKKYGQITLLEPHRRGGAGIGAIWLGECECGNVREFVVRHVVGGRIRTCGNCTKGLGIQGSGQVITQAVPRGHRAHYRRLVKLRSDMGITPKKYIEIAGRPCVCCGNKETHGEWDDETASTVNAELISICSRCSEWRRGRDIVKYLEQCYRVGTHIIRELVDKPLSNMDSGTE